MKVTFNPGEIGEIYSDSYETTIEFLGDNSMLPRSVVGSLVKERDEYKSEAERLETDKKWIHTCYSDLLTEKDTLANRCMFALKEADGLKEQLSEKVTELNELRADSVYETEHELAERIRALEAANREANRQLELKEEEINELSKANIKLQQHGEGWDPCRLQTWKETAKEAWEDHLEFRKIINDAVNEYDRGRWL